MPVKTLYEALLDVQKAARELSLPKSKENPHFRSKYTPLDVVLDAVVPLFNEHGFVVIQSPTQMAGQPALKLTLFHTVSKDEWNDYMLLTPGKNDPQGQGAAITYARRYQIMSVLGLTSDEDDDGNASRAAHTGSTSGTSNGSTNAEQGFEESPI